MPFLISICKTVLYTDAFSISKVSFTLSIHPEIALAEVYPIDWTVTVFKTL